MSDKTTLLREADETFADLRRAIDGLSDEQMREVWLGTWGVREILIHIAGWHHAMIPALQHIARAEAPYPAGTYDDFDAWNARFVAEKAGVKAADVVADLEASHRAFLAASRDVPDRHLESGGAARELFDGVAPGHYREHTAQIREWRQATGR
jgi:hypothetical protein